MRRLALTLLLLLLVAGAPLRAWIERPDERPPCARPEGRGRPPRGWIGCSTDPGPRRDLRQDERLALGLPVDPNRAGARELAFLPGLSPALARAVVEERDRHGPFTGPEALLRVRGIGPGRLAQVRGHLTFASVAAPPGVE